jgi:hypothetical protein
VDPALRKAFNAHYSDALYKRMSAMMGEQLEEPDFGFRLAETPLFLPANLRAKMRDAALEILDVLKRPDTIQAGREAVPPQYRGTPAKGLPQFVAIDFAIVKDEKGQLAPRLIELQGFASLYAMQLVQGEIWGKCVATLPGMPLRFTPRFSALDRASYLRLLRDTVVGDAPVDEVILLEIHPEAQKTRPDFHATRRLLNVRSVDATTIKKEGRKLFAPKGHRMVPVSRIYNRIVFDELEKKGVPLPFDWRDDLDVTWVCHPDWYWIWSKHTLPRIHHPCAPKTMYLSDLKTIPDDCSSYILKPLFSFAGTGVNPDVTKAAIEAIPKAERSNWILQERVHYAPALIAPDGTGVKAEVRLMFLKPESAKEYTLAINLTRLSRGKIHGVDHNKGLEWVGSSVAVWPET